ncbi:MAG: hypothetical protein H6740_20160 [Alphaproteobacteria bacterium]|nr:hypothetical protein [Alphaproteobacteria bacterium]
MIALALLSLAAADDSGWESPCAALRVRDTTPRLHTERTPLDVVLRAVMLDEKPCTFPDEYELLLYERVDDADPILMQSETFTAVESPPSTQFALTPEATLAANTRYRFLVRRLEQDGYDALSQVDFLTGDAPTQGFSGAPGAPELSIGWTYRTEDGRWRVQVGGTVAPILDPDDLSTLQLVTSEDVEFVVESAPVYGSLPVGVVGWWVQDERPDQACLRAQQIDAAGALSELSEPGCVELERGECEGCASGAGGAGAWALALLGLLRRRRSP